MHFSKRLFVSVAAMLLAVSIVPVVVNAQAATPEATCDTTLENDASNVFTTVTKTLQADPIKVSDLGADGVALSNTRQEYEDLTPPPGCESDRTALLQVTQLDEDVVFLNLALRVDTANKAKYVDFTNNTWQPRFNAFSASQSAVATPEATSAVSPQSAASACTDPTFISRVESDLGGLSSLSSADAAGLGAGGVSIMQLRYQYEDMTSPAGCESLRKDIVGFALLGEDALFMRLAKDGDPTNGADYDNFLNDVLANRIQSIAESLNTDLTPATPEAASS